MKKKLLVLLVIATLVISCLAMFTGCTKDQGKVTFILDWAPNTNHTGLYVAKNLGYYAEEGISEIDFVQPGNAGASADVLSGTGQFGIDFQEQMIFNEKKGVDVTAIAAIIQHNTSGILSPVERNILEPKDMAGKKYATWGMPGEQAIVKAMMKDGGVDPETLTMVPKFVENIIAEFQNPDGVDCVWSYAAWDKIMCEEKGLENNFIEMRNIDGLDYYTPVIITNNKLIEENPSLVKAFLKATARGYLYAIEHPKEAADILIEENPELASNKEVIYKSQAFLANEYKSDAKYWGFIDAARWDGFYNLMCEIGGLDFPEDITDGYGFTNEFLPKK